MKKALILAYDFPPYSSMGGQRPFSWFNNFQKLNVFPIAVTRQWPAKVQSKIDYVKQSESLKPIVETSDSGILIKSAYKPNLRDKLLLKFGDGRVTKLRQALSFVSVIFSFLIPQQHNRYSIFKAADKYLKKNKVDVIIATGEPFILFLYANKLSKKHKTPWVADYRDCWSQNFAANLKPGLTKFFFNSFYRFFEKRIVKNAAAITTPADIFKQDLKKIFPAKTIKVIPNGFNPSEFEPFNHIETNKYIFSIGFSGSIYPFQPLELFINGLILFIKKAVKPNISVTFFGIQYNPEQLNRVENAIKGYEKYFNLTRRLSKNELYQKLKEQHLLFLFNNQKMVSGKLFEYLGIVRNILMAGNDDGPMQQIINESAAGKICDTEEEIANYLKELYNEFQQNGKIEYKGANLSKYHRIETSKELISLFDKIIEK